MARIKEYPSITSFDGTNDALAIEQTDGASNRTRKVTPAQLKQYIQSGTFEASGEIKDGHGNILSDVNNKVSIVSNILPGPNLTMLRGVYVKIGTLISVNLVCRATGAITPDSVICNVPANWMANAPLNIFVGAQLVSGANCRIYNGSVRAGANISSGTEFNIQGSYISTT